MGYENYSWDLDDIIKIGDFDLFCEETKVGFHLAKDRFKKLNRTSGAEAFREFVYLVENLRDRVVKITDLPFLMRAKDQESEVAKTLENKSIQLGVEYQEIEDKLTHWLNGHWVDKKKRLKRKNVSNFLSAIPNQRYYFEKRFNFLLPENEESLISFEKENERKTLEDLWTSVKIMNSKKNASVHFDIFRAIINSQKNEAKRRGYESVLSMENYLNDIPDSSVQLVSKICDKNRGVFFNYFKDLEKMRGKELDFEFLDGLEFGNSLDFSLEEAMNEIPSSFDIVSKNFAKKMQDLIESKHLDLLPSEKKKNSCFCLSVSPKIAPYIFMNYRGKFEDLTNLIHEFGHGIAYSFMNSQSPFFGDASPFIDEVNSLFSEQVLLERLCQSNKKSVRNSAKMKRIHDAFFTVFLQNFLADFETQSYAKIDDLNSESISSMYENIFSYHTSNLIKVDSNFSHGWIEKDHLVEAPFYHQKYVIGYLLSASLFALYKNYGREFIPKYERFLSGMNSRDPQDSLLEIGININSKSFWKNGFSIIQQWEHDFKESLKK